MTPDVPLLCPGDGVISGEERAWHVGCVLPLTSVI